MSGSEDELSGDLSALRDENRRLHRALESAERERVALEQFLDTPAIAMTQMRRDGTIVRINTAGARNLGGTPAEVQGKNIYELFPALADQTRGRIEQTLDTAEPLSVETVLQLPGGERWFRSTYYPVLGGGAEPETVHLVSQDITQVKQLEQLVEATEGRLSVILEYAPQLVVVLDPDGTIRYINRTTILSMDQVIGTAAESHLPEPYIQRFHDSLRRVLDHAEPDLIEIDDLFGRHWEVRLAPILRHGLVHQVLAFVVDISERREAEERQRQLEAQVQHSQKLESLGVLAGGIAHDFNNLLVGILGNAQLALAETTAASARECLQDVVQASQQAADLCRQMLAFAGRGKVELDAVDVSAVSTRMLDLVRPSVSKRTQIRSDCPAGLPLVMGDAAQLGQVVMNLLTNASDALASQSGVLTLRCEVIDCDAAHLSKSYVDEKASPGRYVCVEVRDTGCGMDAETRARMFDPFYTTKRMGSGLGLSAVLGIVRRHHGAILVDSEPGRGTVVRVLLPVAERFPSRSEETAPPALRQAGTILVVDDEPMVRTVARRALEMAGHRVILASDGIEALERYDADPGAVDAVLLDLSMPRMDGAEALGELRARDPKLPVVLASGFSMDAPVRLDDAATRFIAKPYDLAELVATLRRAMTS